MLQSVACICSTCAAATLLTATHLFTNSLLGLLGPCNSDSAGSAIVCCPSVCNCNYQRLQ